MTVQVILLVSGATWTPPADAVGASAKIVCIGAGANGNNAGPVSPPAAGGGGGGAAVKNVFVIPSTTPIPIQIPAAGSGSDCWFNSTSTVRTTSGSGTTPGAGAVGDVLHTGGTGGASGGPSGGNGGGAGAEAANASGTTSGSGATAGNPGTEYSITAGGVAGAGGGGLGGGGAGGNGGSYGGGGAGGFSATSGGAATQGAIVVIYETNLMSAMLVSYPEVPMARLIKPKMVRY